MLVSILAPIAAVGYVLAGIFASYWWQAVAAASLWAICMSLLVSALNSQYQAFHWNTTYLATSVVGYPLATLVVFGIKHAIKRRRKPL
jgi:uncharacterized membrane protein